MLGEVISLFATPSRIGPTAYVKSQPFFLVGENRDLIIPQKGEGKGHACVKAWLRQLHSDASCVRYT
jgi:hypothetical protein